MADALENLSIIRHKLKLAATVNNAIAVQKIQEEFGSFSTYLWNFVGESQLTTLSIKRILFLLKQNYLFA